ncbi:MAG: hypothetical protein HXY34_13790 [Candidatus Thorarchaeota archaeon]|nr:hypothetical protein [Candidatus Thorarchaeota archaeon]
MYEQDGIRVKLVDRDLRRIVVEHGDIVVSYPLNVVPDRLLQALAAAVDHGATPEEQLNGLYSSSLMKPTVCTCNQGRPFHVNTATKIVRPTLTDEIIEKKIEELEGTLLGWQGRRFEDTLAERIDVYRDLFCDERRIDRFRLSAVEMFGTGTHQNIQRDPRVTLHFMWSSDPDIASNCYQLNCIAEIVPPGSPFYRYSRFMRSLFSSRFLHVDRADYICAYRLWVVEARDKSLAPRPGFPS